MTHDTTAFSMHRRALLALFPLLASCMMTGDLHAQPPTGESAAAFHQRYQWMPVSGVGTHYFSTAIVHSVEPTATGFIQRSTETVELEGDLVGRVLYHPVSEFDFQAGTLINTGSQVFSGTVLGSAPVLLHDDEFRVEVDLNQGTTSGQMFLTDHLEGPKVRCLLEIFGSGVQTPEGDAVVDYSGECRVRVPMSSPRPLP
jgi:hypothetical protein